MFTKSNEDSDIRTTPAARPQASSNGAPSIIGPDVRIVGNVSTAGELQLDGIVEGDVNCGAITMGEHGSVTGAISAEQLTVRGKVEGTIRAKVVRLEHSAKVAGDVWHETLSIEAGALVDGKFIHSENLEKRSPRAPKVAATPVEKTDDKRSDGSSASKGSANGNGKSAAAASL